MLYYQILHLVRLLHDYLPRDDIVERDQLCAGVCPLCCCCLLVASVVDVVVVHLSLAVCVVHVSAVVLVGVAGFAFHDFPREQV